MELIQGLGDAVEEEYSRIRTELRLAIAESPYTIQDVSTLAKVGERTLRRILAGSHSPQLDSLLRIAYVVGVRVDLNRLAETAPSFQAVPLATGSRRSSASSSRARGSADTAQTLAAKRAKKAAKQRKGSAAAKRRTPGGNALVIYLRKHNGAIRKSAKSA